MEGEGEERRIGILGEVKDVMDVSRGGGRGVGKRRKYCSVKNRDVHA